MKIWFRYLVPSWLSGEREVGEGGHDREIGGLEVGGRGVGDPGEHRDHRDLTERRFERGVHQHDEVRVHYSAGVRGGPLVQAVVHADDGQRQHDANDGQKAHDVGDRALGHEAAEDEHPDERERAAISDSTERKCWSNFSSSIIHQVTPVPGAGHGAEDEDDDGSADERRARLGLELARQLAR